MSNIATKLATLNSLRAIAGKAPLAQWKNSEADLDQRIKDLTPGEPVKQHKVLDPDRSEVLAALEAAKAKSDVKPTVIPEGKSVLAEQKAQAKKDKKAAKKPAAKPTPAKPAKKATATKAPRSGNEFGALLTEMGLDPKQARATLRRKGFAAPYTDLKAIRAALTTDARKAK